MKYFITFIFVITGWCARAASGYLLKNTPGVIDTPVAVVKKQSLSIGLNYGTDDSFFGRTSPTRDPFLSTDIIYNTKDGLFVYSSLWKVLESAPTIDEVDLGGGYSYRFSKKFKGEISYTRFFFDAQSSIIKSSASNDINFKNTYDWKWFKTSGTVDYLFGKSHDVFLTATASRYFESNWSVFDDKDYLTIEPAFSLIWGTQNFVQNYSKDHEFDNMPPGTHSPGQPTNPAPTTPTPASYEMDASKNRQFKLLNYSFKLPLDYNRPHYTLEAAYKYAIPVNVQGPLYNNHESFFNLTFYYVFY